MTKMDESTLKALVASEIRGANGYNDELRLKQNEALKRYRGEPYGPDSKAPEREDHSQVVSMDGQDAVEWTAPYMMTTFLGTKRPVEFGPVGPEDVESARLKTDYINHVYMKDNPGFSNTLTMIKDGLTQKIGILKIWSEEIEEAKVSSHSGLTDDEVAALLDDDTEVLERDQEENGLWEIKISRKEKKRRTRVVPVPPEEFRVSRRAKSDDDAHFLAHEYEETKSNLILQGYDKDIVEGLPTGTSSESTSNTRHDDEDLPTEPKVSVVEAFYKVDFDGDGVAERRFIVMAGEEMLENEEIDDHPFVTWSPIPQPHKIVGLSLMDAVENWALIKTVLLRQMLDNLYLTNEPRKKCIDGEYDEDQVQNSAVGGILNVDRPESITNDETPFVAAQSFPMIEYIDSRLEGQTGTGARTQGLSEDLMKTHQVRGNVEQVISMAQQRQELIARVFGEAFARVFKKILKLEIKYQDKARQIRLNGKFIEVDPKHWDAGMDVDINVGLGKGNKDAELNSLSNILSIQERIIDKAGPIEITMTEVYSTFRDMVEIMGRPSVDPYMKNPADPAVKKARDDLTANAPPSEAEVFGQVEQAKIAQREQSDLRDAELKKRQQDIDAFLKLRELGLEGDLAQLKAQVDRESNELKASIATDKNLIDLEKNASVQ